MKISGIIFFSVLCNMSLPINSETFVKEKTKRGKVSLGKCQEMAIGPLATLVNESHATAVLAQNLVKIGTEITEYASALLGKALDAQERALEATADLIDEERGGGRFVAMKASDLQVYCDELEQASSELKHIGQVVHQKKVNLDKVVNELRESMCATDNQKQKSIFQKG